MDEYYQSINSGIFFTKNIGERVKTLYEAFQEHPHLSAKFGHELIGDDFEQDHRILPRTIFEETYYDCRYTDVQISTYIEHKARLAILKNLIDYKIFKDIGDKEKTDKYYKILGIEISILDFLPSSFSISLDEISDHRYFRKYPFFWQFFLWVFGGFILNDYEEMEYSILSAKTGIPVNEIPNAFKFYESLFPIEGGWLVDLPNTNIKGLKMFSVPFRGIGANYRRIHYGEGSFKNLHLTGSHTYDDLIKWNNLVVDVFK